MTDQFKQRLLSQTDVMHISTSKHCTYRAWTLIECLLYVRNVWQDAAICAHRTTVIRPHFPGIGGFVAEMKLNETKQGEASLDMWWAHASLLRHCVVLSNRQADRKRRNLAPPLGQVTV